MVGLREVKEEDQLPSPPTLHLHGLVIGLVRPDTISEIVFDSHKTVENDGIGGRSPLRFSRPIALPGFR